MNVETPLDRLVGRIDLDGECWLWTGGCNGGGYPVAVIGGRHCLVHRVMYELFVGPIPEGFQVDHVWDRGCRHRNCVRPSHLEAVTPRENTMRSRVLRKACKHGHPFVEGSFYYRYGHRRCRICERLANRRAWMKRTGRTEVSS